MHYEVTTMLLLFWNGSGTKTGAVKIVPLKGVVMANSTAVSITPATGKVAV